ncbi:MAG: hypothetical protein U0X93_07905 [Anaerolineales bacterium]
MADLPRADLNYVGDFHFVFVRTESSGVSTFSFLPPVRFRSSSRHFLSRSGADSCSPCLSGHSFSRALISRLLCKYLADVILLILFVRVICGRDGEQSIPARIYMRFKMKERYSTGFYRYLSCDVVDSIADSARPQHD